jgi:ubiquinone biosynthesis protein UbiJ
MILETPFAAALNHLLDAEPWARERLVPFAGDAVELRAPPFPTLRLAIQAEGRLRPGAPDAEPALVITVRPDAPAAFLRGEDHFMRAVQVSGNPRLAEAVMLLVRHLRWDFEEDLSRLVGDVAAHRLAQGARDFAAWQADAARRLAESVADYLTEEKRLLLRRPEQEAFAAEVARLRDGVERLQKRIERLG